ncbi:MAG: hypothetical protein K0R05_3340 [Anaerocolumna sp.]|jgi:hypothetical protein|nr:hypothetical protein [Anaerocolumna sp.]
MLEIVFNNSVKGAMKCAMHYNYTNIIGGVSAISIIGDATKKDIKSFLRREAKKRKMYRSLEGSPQDIISLPFQLDIGDISGNILDDKRKKLLNLMNTWTIPGPPGMEEPFQESLKQGLEAEGRDAIADYNRLIDYAQKGGDIRIWWSDTPYSACGYYSTISILASYKCKITAVKLPKYLSLDKKSVMTFSSWSEVEAGYFYYFLPYEQEIPKWQLEEISNEWKQLKKENAPLRAVINGTLNSVSDDFYDTFLKALMPAGEFTVAQLISEILTTKRLGVSDRWYQMRINNMIEREELCIVKDDPDKLRKILKRV